MDKDTQDKIDNLRKVIDEIDRMSSETQDLLQKAVEENPNDPMAELNFLRNSYSDAIQALKMLLAEHGKNGVAVLRALGEANKE